MLLPLRLGPLSAATAAAAAAVVGGSGSIAAPEDIHLVHPPVVAAAAGLTHKGQADQSKDFHDGFSAAYDREGGELCTPRLPGAN